MVRNRRMVRASVDQFILDLRCKRLNVLIPKIINPLQSFILNLKGIENAFLAGFVCGPFLLFMP